MADVVGEIHEGAAVSSHDLIDLGGSTHPILGRYDDHNGVRGPVPP